MKRTREAHKAREAWLNEVWQTAGLDPLTGRTVKFVNGKWQRAEETESQKINSLQLQREFPPKGDSTCYNSAILRIKLLSGEKLEPWQIYKALRSSIQKRGYGQVPWANRELGKKEISLEQAEKELKKQDEELAKKDPAYRHTLEAWPAFKKSVSDDFHFSCYYDAMQMGLWHPSAPKVLGERITCNAASTRNIRFDRIDIEREVYALASSAVAQLPQLASLFKRVKESGWIVCDVVSAKQKSFRVFAEDFGEFFVHGPAGAKTLAARNDFEAVSYTHLTLPTIYSV